MKKFTLKKKMIAGAAAGALVLGVAGGAFAFWTTGGSGTGTAATSSTNAIAVNQTTSSTALVPDGSTTLSGDFTNSTNPGPVYITTVSASIDTFSLAADATKPACTDADFTLTTASVPVGADVAHTAVGGHTGSWSGIVLKMNDSALNQDNCKNISVPLTYSAS
ncbi:MAG: hypothetical protein JWM72_851 [Actinomycetia bacterium]|nr:hypothetical protein [Actinomycetes bacterium]